jgi:hypothetical protein
MTRRIVICLALLAAGCANDKKKAPTTQPSGGGDPADRAMRDPARYSPDWSDTGVTNDTDKLDRKGLGRDLGNVFMP